MKAYQKLYYNAVISEKKSVYLAHILAQQLLYMDIINVVIQHVYWLGRENAARYLGLYMQNHASHVLKGHTPVFRTKIDVIFVCT